MNNSINVHVHTVGTFLMAVIMGYLKLGDCVQPLRERKVRRRGREEGAGDSVLR